MNVAQLAVNFAVGARSHARGDSVAWDLGYTMLLPRVLAVALLLLLACVALLLLLACVGSGGGAGGEGNATDYLLEAGGGTSGTQPGTNAKAQRLQDMAGYLDKLRQHVTYTAQG